MQLRSAMAVLVSVGLSGWVLIQQGPGAPDGAYRNEVRIFEDGGFRRIESNGIPNHKTGRFPNRGNPNTIRPQRHSFRMPLKPEKADDTTPLPLGLFGVAVNGVPFDPGAAEFWNNDRRSGWQFEALSGRINLGMDSSNAHVQPTGSYHYHGIPLGLVEKLSGKTPQMLLVGYAADGFPIYGPQAFSDPQDARSDLKTLTSSWRLKSGPRPNGPGGRHDGTYVQDYEYVAESGDLDECNGREGVTPEFPQGTYYYVLTEEFPFIPRSFRGVPDQSFQHRGPPPGGGRPGMRPPPPPFGRPPPR